MATVGVTAGPSTGGRAALIPMLAGTVLAGAALAGTSAVSAVALVAAVAVMQAVLVVSWIYGAGVPGRIGGVVIGLAAAGAADAVVVRWHDNGYQPLLAVLGLAIPVMFVHQLSRGVMRRRVVESLSDIAVCLAAVSALTGLILLRYSSDGDKTVAAVVGAVVAGLAVDHIVDLGLPMPRFDSSIDRGLSGVIVGVVAGGAVGAWALRDIVDFTGGRAAFAGGVVAAVACLVSVGASFAGAHSTLAARRAPAAAGGATTPRLAVVSDSDEDPPLWRGVPRLRPVAASLMTIALAVPAGYVLINALGS